MRVVVTDNVSYISLPDLSVGLTEYANDLETKGLQQAPEVLRIVVGFLLDYMLQAHSVSDPS